MAERYIFNKSLNRRVPRWYWLAFAVAAIFSLTVFVSPVKAQEPLLVDPDTKRNASTVTTTVTNIDFTQAANNTAVTLVSFEGQAPKLQLIESQGKVSLTLPNTKLGEDQLVELNVADFGTLVSTIETFEDKDGARIEVNYSGPVTVKNTVKDGVIRMAITPMDSAQQDALEAEKKYTGDPISLDFQDVPVRQVLQIIAQVNGFNLVTTDTVTGNVTISLSGVPWDQALDMILRVKGLDKRLEGNILLIAPAEELSARETQALQSKKQVSDLAPLHTVNIPVNYALYGRCF